MKIAYFDCIAGASGDMILGALLDAGLPEVALQAQLAALKLDEFELRSQRVLKNGFRATKVHVLTADDVSERRFPEIEDLLRKCDLPVSIKDRSIAIFQRLSGVEADIHGTTLDEVHLHELGGLDTIVDVVGTLVGLDILGIERLYASPLPLGRGFVHGAHGPIPLPAPATVALLQGTPVVGSDLQVELVTPTGAALLTSLAESFGPIPSMKLEAVGYGAGTKDLPIPNVLRLLLGTQEIHAHATIEMLVELETNIDDLNPEIYDYVMARLFEAGALDISFTPIQMKKNRPGTLLRVLCKPGDAETMTLILFSETSTLGVRKQFVERQSLARSTQTVETPYGPIRVKVAQYGERQIKIAPEYDDCRKLAELRGISLLDVYRAAESLALDTL